MAEIEISKNSWLNLAELLDYKGVLFWDQAFLPEIPFSDDDFYITLTQFQANRIDLIAHEYYGDAQMMWVILHANDVDLPNQFVEGQTIRLPPKEMVSTLIRTAKEKQREF